MAEPISIKGFVARIWEKDRSDGKGHYTIVKLEGSDEAYFDFSGKANKASVQEGDQVEIKYLSNGNTKILSITKVVQEKQTELRQEKIGWEHPVAEMPKKEDPTAWRIARTSALKVLLEGVDTTERMPQIASDPLFYYADRLAAYIVTGNHPEMEKPAKKKK